MIPGVYNHGTKTFVGESYAPVPHSISRVVTKSGNYGLADDARRVFREMEMQAKREEEQNRSSGLGRGRGRFVNLDDDGRGPTLATFMEQVVIGSSPTSAVTGYSGWDDLDRNSESQSSLAHMTRGCGQAPSVVPNETQLTQPGPSRGATACESEQPDRDAGASADTATATVGARLSLGKPKGKASGYIMFLQYIKRQKGGPAGMSVNDLIRLYDPDWKALSDVEKAEWKLKAKQGPKPQQPQQRDYQRGGRGNWNTSVRGTNRGGGVVIETDETASASASGSAHSNSRDADGEAEEDDSYF